MHHGEGPTTRLSELMLPGMGSAQLTTELAIDRTNRILELNPSDSDKNARAELMRIFGGGQVANGAYVPLKVENVRESLQLRAPFNAAEEDEPTRSTRSPKSP